MDNNQDILKSNPRLNNKKQDNDNFFAENSKNSPKIVKTNHNNSNRRDFLGLITTSFGCFGAGCFLYPLLNSLTPAKDTTAANTIEIDLSNIPVGTTKIFSWQGKPIFIKHRTQDEILIARQNEIDSLKDPELDSNRVKDEYPQWLVVIGICTHLGCIPKTEKNGWLCPCHGSKYDLSGRIVSGPAMTNLNIPPYEFLNPTLIKIG